MERTISRRELRNDNAEIMRALGSGDTFIITRNGVPVGRLTPVPRRTFVRPRNIGDNHPSGPKKLESYLIATVEGLPLMISYAAQPSWMARETAGTLSLPQSVRATLSATSVVSGGSCNANILDAWRRG